MLKYIAKLQWIFEWSLCNGSHNNYIIIINLVILGTLKSREMYINQPILKNDKKKPKTTAKLINQYQFSTPQQQSIKTNQSFQAGAQKGQDKFNKKKSRVIDKDFDDGNALTIDELDKQSQFENNLAKDLKQLIRKWENNLKCLSSQLKPFQQIKQTQSEIRAFIHCKQLLQSQFNQAQERHEQQNKLMDKKKLQVDDYKLRLIKQIEQLKQINKQLNEQKSQFEIEQKQRQKRVQNKNAIAQKIRYQKQKIEKLRGQLMKCKQKSYEQKNQFIEIQSQQFRLENQIRQEEEEEQKYQGQVIRKQKYEQLIKIKQKIISSQSNIQEEVRPHLQRKIEKMARLRSSLASLQDALQICLTKIQDQNIIIQALKEKSYHQQAYQSEGGGGNLYDIYHKKYNQLYFGSKSEDGKDWKDYSNYLKHLVNRSSLLNDRIHTQMPNSYGSPKNNNQQYNEVLDLRPNFAKRNTQDKFYNNSTKISRNPQKYQTQQTNSKGTKLPRLVKVEGKPSEQANLKKKVKDGILKNNNKQDDFQLESISSNASKISGEVIEVQFHKR